MSQPFREDNHTDLAMFEKHISIAEELLNTIVELSAQLATYTDPELVRSRGDAWTGLWEQLQQARAIVERLGRDVAPYDAICGGLENPYIVSGRLGAIKRELLAAALAAMNALRATAPEIVIPSALTTATIASTSSNPTAATPPAAPARSAWDTQMVRFRIGIFIFVVIAGVIRCTTL